MIASKYDILQCNRFPELDVVRRLQQRNDTTMLPAYPLLLRKKTMARREVVGSFEIF